MNLYWARHIYIQADLSYPEDKYSKCGGIMCLVLWACDCHEKYKLVIAANRDEYYHRPALPAAFWSEKPSTLAGKDMKEGGTWMGVTTSGRFATLTNYRDPSSFDPAAPSRGHLVKKYLENDIHPKTYLQSLLEEDVKYNGFNLLVGNCDEIYYFSNREKLVRKVGSGFHGLSNSLINVPWPKVKKGIKGLEDCLKHADVEVERLFELMADKERAADHELPSTGVSLELERVLSPVFIESAEYDYGTRTTTIILMDRDNVVQFWERTFSLQQTGLCNEVHYKFCVQRPL